MDTLKDIKQQLLKMEDKHDELFENRQWDDLYDLNLEMNALVTQGVAIAVKHNIVNVGDKLLQQLPMYARGGPSFAYKNAKWFC